MRPDEKRWGALIADDEPAARRGVRQLLAAFPEFVVVGECRTGVDVLSSLDTLKPAVVFLDVQMPGMDGFEVIRRRTPERMPAVVFLTAYDDFAIKAFEAQALDYLVKPLSEARFRVTMTRVLERLRIRGRNRIAVQTGSGELLLDDGEIDWIEAQDDHAAIHAGAKRYRVRQSLAAFESQLDPERFARVHRSAIVRLDHVRELTTTYGGGETIVMLRDGTTLPVSRRRLARLRARLRPTRR